jgi:hypothetical protein
VLLAADQVGPWCPLWVILAVGFGALSALPAFGLDVSTGRRLELVLFHLLATVAIIAVVCQQLVRWTPLVAMQHPLGE